jgi:LacI family transcriptional regulator
MSGLPTIEHLATALGMHKSTVSKALSGTGNVSSETRERVRLAARELGYQPNPIAQRLANGHRNPTVYIFTAILDQGLATQKIRQIQRELTLQGLEVPIYACPDPEPDTAPWQAEQIRQLCRQRPRAIVCATQLVSPEVFPELEAYQRGGGIVVTYDMPSPLACDQVIFDRENNAYRAARHLLDAGHRDLGIGMTRLPPWLTEGAATSQDARLTGFRRALAEFGLTLRPEWLFQNGSYEEGGDEMAARFLAMSERPTGLCIVNDYVAFAFMIAVTGAGVRIPEEVSVISHDNQPIAARCPVPMTSVSHPAPQIAQEVVRLLRERLDGYAGPPRTIVVQGELIERASVKPLK